MVRASMDQTKDELTALCEELGIDYSSRDTKEILVDKINEASHFDSQQDAEESQSQPPAPQPAAQPSKDLKKFHKFQGAK